MTKLVNEVAATLTAEEMEMILAARAAKAEESQPEWEDELSSRVEEQFLAQTKNLEHVVTYTQVLQEGVRAFLEVTKEERKERALLKKEQQEQTALFELEARRRIDELSDEETITHHRQDGSTFSYTGKDAKKWAKAIGYNPQFSAEAYDLRYTNGMLPHVFKKICVLDEGTWRLRTEQTQVKPAKALAALAVGVGAIMIIKKLMK